MTARPRASLRTRLLLGFLVVALVPLLVAGGITYRRLTIDARAEAASKLEAIRNLKVSRIDAWVDELSRDMHDFGADAAAALVPKGAGPLRATPAARAELRERFQSFLRTHANFTEILILDGSTGKVLVASTQAREGEDHSESHVFPDAVKTRQLTISDLRLSAITHAPRLSFAAPVLRAEPGAPVAAVVVADVDLGALSALLQERAGMGATGETVVLGRDQVAINELRHVQGAPLKLRLDTEPAVRAARGETATIEARDYRGVECMAAFTYLPRTRWGLVAKQDLEEVYATARSSVRWLAVALGGALALVLVLSTFLARSVARPIQAMRDTAEAIRGGNLDARNRLQRSDELGVLATAFDDMADHVQAQMGVQQGGRAIVEAMVHAVTVPAFCADLLEAALKATRSELGAVYLADVAGRFSPAASLGLSAGALEPFDGLRGEGALGAAVVRRQLQHLADLPADTRFTFRTLAGTAVPRALLAIPLVAQDRVAAVLALGSPRPYGPEVLEVVERSQVAMSIGLANLLASEETGRLARQLADRNVELQSQATELRKQSDALEQQNVELEVQATQVTEANRHKSEFLSNMSHELRTPLNSVLALSRVLRLQTTGRLTEEEGSYLQIIERNGARLLSLINDILDLAKIESGRVELASEEVSLPEQLGAVVEGLEPVAREKGISLSVDVEAGLPRLRTDSRRLHQVLQNVIGNAVKFTRVGGVTVTVRRREEVLEVAVRDTGIGIPEQALATIFDEFRQVDGSASRSYEGTGLGLAIAARSARLLGGGIAVQSRPGAGSIFTVTLPLQAASAAPQGPGPEGAPRPGPEPDRRLVLVVDDDPADAAALAVQLQRQGYATMVATSGDEGLRLAERFLPFAITLDVIMPGLDGWEVLLALKRNPATASIPVVIVSISEDRATGLALGAFGVVSKPVDPDRLLAEFHRLAGAVTRSVLVVDDDDGDRARLAALLADRGLEVRQARDGAEGLAAARQRLPDVMALDLVMPGMSGFEVLEALRADPATHHLPVVIVTAKDLSRTEQELLRGRVEAVVEKGRLTADQVPAELSRILARLAGPGRGPGAPPAGDHRPAPVAPPPDRPRLLLVEDSEPAIIQVRLALETAGYRVDVARGGREAIALMGDPPPDGIILDLMMPQVDGFAVLDRLRGTPATAEVPVLILTAKDLTAADLSRLRANHVHQLIQKGDVDREQLLGQVARLLGRPAPGGAPARVAPPAPPPPRPGGSGPVILAIEDNPDNMTTLRAVLGRRWRLIEARDGEEGLAYAMHDHPDLVLLDMSLPRLDGLGVLARLRAHPDTRALRVVALTADAMKGDRERLLAAGCDDYLAKPIDVDRLLELVAHWLATPAAAGG